MSETKLHQRTRPGRADDEVMVRLERHRVELTAYCYRMLGSPFEAEDAVQETLLRAWRAFDSFEERSSLRSWLYRIATNVCLDMLSGRERRARPMDLGGAGSASGPLGEPMPEVTWLEPVPDANVLTPVAAGKDADAGDPADVAEQRESIRLAFVAALQHLPPKQRAVLILREVLRWKATEVAELLDTTVQSVNSALQRARATLAASHVEDDRVDDLDPDHQELLAKYVRAFESYDMGALTALLREDAHWNMPPYALWLRTHQDIVDWCMGTGYGCKDSRLVPVSANGMAAFGQYKPDPENGGLSPWSVQVIELDGDRIVGITFFLDTERLFPLFGLPMRFEG
jgi:RNA polymerase sigma-70 factor (ECF subfamily)